MDCTASRVPYRNTGYFSPLILDYLDAKDSVRPFYLQDNSSEGIRAAIDNRRKFGTDRSTLVQTLLEQYETISSQPSVTENIRRLTDANCFTITTAHQPAIFTGNLYFIYKILHVIRVAEQLKSAHPDCSFVPVFYMGSEDADLEELGHIFIRNEKISWDTKQQGAVGRMNPKGLEKIIDRIAGEFSEQPFGPEILRLLRDAYLRQPTLQQGTFQLLHELFGAYGLVVLIPDHASFKRQLVPVFREDLFAQFPAAIVSQSTAQLGKNYAVQAQPRPINLFYLKEDIRERIELTDGIYSVHNTDIRFTKSEMEAELESHPERFSPNVILRGLLQETILPNIIFVGGGGETAYWLELRSLFEHFQVPYPVLLLRNSFLFIQRSWRQQMDKAGLDAQTIFQPATVTFEKAVKENSTKQLSLSGELNLLEKEYAKIRAMAVAVDTTLGQHVEALRVQAVRRLKELEKKLVKAEKKNFLELKLRIEKVRNGLFPLNNLQERIENFIPYYAKYGKAFIDMLYQHSLTTEQQFVILEEQ